MQASQSNILKEITYKSNQNALDFFPDEVMNVGKWIVKCTNFLGVIIDSNLNWELHFRRTYNRISSNLFIINRLSKMLDMNVWRMLYYGMIYPPFRSRNWEYGRRDLSRLPRFTLYQQEVGTNFADKLRSLSWYSSLADLGHGAFFLSSYGIVWGQSAKYKYL
jgi:hypothetical protein